MNNSEFKTVSGEEVMKDLLGTIKGIIESSINIDMDDECDCSQCEQRRECEAANEEMQREEESSEEVSFPEFLASILSNIKSQGAYNFVEMVNEFDGGFDGEFISEEGDIIRYDNDSKTVLTVAKDAIFPSSIDSRLVNLRFEKRKKEVSISSSKALEVAMAGEKAYFTADISGTKVSGYITSNNGVPGFAIKDNMPGMRPETLVIMALFNGTWTLK